MKKPINCILCKKMFFSKDLRKKFCPRCKISIATNNYNNRRNLLIKGINNNLFTIKIKKTNGGFNISTEKNIFRLKDTKLETVSNKDYLINYLIELKKNIDKDLIEIQTRK